MLKRFLENRKPGFYLLLASFITGLLTLIIYTVRGGNYLSPISGIAVALLILGLVTNVVSVFLDFGIVGILPVIFYSCALAVLLNTEMLFITNVAFGVDGNFFDFAFFLFWIFDILSIILAAVGFSIGTGRKEKKAS